MQVGRNRCRASRVSGWALGVAGGLLAATGVIYAADEGQLPASALGDMSLEQLLDVQVVGAALHPQALADAPASVTVITAEDIHRYGYRTLAEALASVRGFYTNNNHTYQTVGVRGFNVLGDYGSRFLVMVNGHVMTDNVLNFQLFFGEDFPVEMTLVERIEVIRGPSSALYGSNGVFATINVVTKTPEQAGPPALTTTVGSFGEWKSQATSTLEVGGARMLLSVSGLHKDGESPLYVPGYDTPETNFGEAIHMDQLDAYHAFANVEWGRWNFTTVVMKRKKIQPVSWGPTVFNDRGTSVTGWRGFAEAAYTRAVGGGTLLWRTYYDAFTERGRYMYAEDSGDPFASVADDDRRQPSVGKWVGSQVTFRRAAGRVGTFTAGVEGKGDIVVHMAASDVSGKRIEYFRIDRPDRMFGAFLQHEKELGPWKISLGLRADTSIYRRSFFSPRAALIFQPSKTWDIKFLYGRSFRNPSAFELFFGDGFSGASNPTARPERADTVEVALDRELGSGWSMTTSVYGYHLRDFLLPRRNEKGLFQYRNVGAISAAGAELELSGRPSPWLEATVSYALQHSDDYDGDGVLENSPHHLGKLRFAVPLGNVNLATAMRYQSSRRSAAGHWAHSVSLADFTVSTHELLANLDVQFGIRNAFDRHYSDPVAMNPRVDLMPQEGRIFFVELTGHGRE